jgi:hypothetical protein
MPKSKPSPKTGMARISNIVIMVRLPLTRVRPPELYSSGKDAACRADEHPSDRAIDASLDPPPFRVIWDSDR